MRFDPVPKRLAIRNLLVATDFSTASDAAVKYAAAWATRLGAALHVAHFIQPAMSSEGFAEIMKKRWQEGRAGMTAIAESPILRGVPRVEHLEAMNVEEGLADLVRQCSIDLLVLASSGRRGLAKVVSGSIAEASLRALSCPVITLGPQATRAAVPVPPRTILVATDLTPASDRALTYARALAWEWKSGLHLLRVVKPTRNGGVVNPGVLDRVKESLMRSSVGKLAAEPPYGATIRYGRPAEEILRSAHEVGADLIVLGAHAAPGFSFYTGRRTVYRVICDARCPVLTTRDAAVPWNPPLELDVYGERSMKSA